MTAGHIAKGQPQAGAPQEWEVRVEGLRREKRRVKAANHPQMLYTADVLELRSTTNTLRTVDLECNLVEEPRVGQAGSIASDPRSDLHLKPCSPHLYRPKGTATAARPKRGKSVRRIGKHGHQQIRVSEPVKSTELRCRSLECAHLTEAAHHDLAAIPAPG